MNFSQILLCEFAIGSNCESEAKANAFQKLRSESEAKSIQFCAKRSEANSLRFAIFRNRANSHCEFGALHEVHIFNVLGSSFIDNYVMCSKIGLERVASRGKPDICNHGGTKWTVNQVKILLSLTHLLFHIKVIWIFENQSKRQKSF